MRGWGTALIVVGVLMTIIAFSMDTSVSSFDGSSVNNIGLLQKQMMVFQAGLATFIVGAMLFVGSTIRQGGSDEVLATTRGSHSHETDEEREQRLAGVREMHRTIGLGLLGLLALIVVVMIIMSVR